MTQDMLPDGEDPRPIGPLVEGFTVPPAPSGEVLKGSYARLEPLRAETHAARLFRAYDGDTRVWRYLPYGPFSSSAQYHRWVRDTEARQDPFFFAVHSTAAAAYLGVASFLRIKPTDGSIEVGHINFAPALQGTRAATDAMFLMMEWAFEAGYRRYEWKCNSLNLGSRRAAQRLGFSYEGTFRQATISKGRNRDTAWFSVIDSEWPALKEAFAAWLAPSNFDETGTQKERLSDLTRLVRASDDPALS
ncbi:GNAT family N-acetyltransferase [Pseudaestuariivita sp.]|uniref:GNAT family N-acetyltransferase n=1 Tax=Pseudaestuariivita sp. TaxID=2211669 RepID=UPI00405A0AEA